ncbi:MAG: aquaporin [Verrucomicrobiota bacterium]|nr:aquaporin [Verrucomicrobiota bacterium]
MKNALIAEFIGTFFLYLIIGLCVTPPTAAGVAAPVAIGVGLAALVYSCGHLSKAHFNPATTIAFATAGTHTIRKSIPFILVIFAGALSSAVCLMILSPEGLEQVNPLEIDRTKVIMAEFLFTFVLIWVILNVAIAKCTADNGFYGIAIGAIVAAGAYAVGPLSLAAFNPAVTLAFCINGFLPPSALPLYWITQAIAAFTAGIIFKRMKATNEKELRGKPWN